MGHSYPHPNIILIMNYKILSELLYKTKYLNTTYIINISIMSNINKISTTSILIWLVGIIIAQTISGVLLKNCKNIRYFYKILHDDKNDTNNGI